MLDDFGRNLLNELRKKNITQLELSRRTGISNSNISKWLKKKMIPSVRSIEKVAKALNISVDRLTTNCEKNHNTEQIADNSQITNDKNNINILLNKILILEKEIEIIKLKLNNK